MNAKLKEELADRELIGCTFKPLINDRYETNREEEVFDEPRMPRYDQLYKMGMQIVSSKKDKLKDDIEVDLYGKDCTFKPNIEKPRDDSKEYRFENDIYNEKSYELLYSRLKNGRTVNYPC